MKDIENSCIKPPQSERVRFGLKLGTITPSLLGFQICGTGAGSLIAKPLGMAASTPLNALRVVAKSVYCFYDGLPCRLIGMHYISEYVERERHLTPVGFIHIGEAVSNKVVCFVPIEGLATIALAKTSRTPPLTMQEVNICRRRNPHSDHRRFLVDLQARCCRHLS
jgi:hypothetical protein